MGEIYEVYWEGPYTEDTLEKLTAEENHKFVLYQIYGSHPVYGNNVLLYIGMTEQSVKKRLMQHDYWMDEARFSLSKMYFASIGSFSSWSESEKIEIFNRAGRDIIEKVEALLIYAHQPVHNTKSRSSAKMSRSTRIFNSGSFGVLMPEISGKYHDC